MQIPAATPKNNLTYLYRPYIIGKTIEPIGAEFDEVADSLISEGFRPTQTTNKNNELIINTADLVPPRLRINSSAG